MSKHIDKDKALEYIAPTIEVSEDYVSREVVLNLMRYWGEVYTNDKIMEVIESLPPIEPKRPKGEWQVRFPYEDTGKTRTCSNCNITQTVNVYDGKVKFRFCPYCGADMRGEKEESEK